MKKNGIFAKLISLVLMAVLLASCAPLSASPPDQLSATNSSKVLGYDNTPIADILTPNKLLPQTAPEDELSSLLVRVNDQVDVSPNVLPGGSSDETTANVKPSGSTGISSPMPAIDFAMKSGKKFDLSCYAPADASVTATVGGNSVSLKKGKAANGMSLFKGSYTMPSTEGTLEIGKVIYQATVKSKSYKDASEGSLFAVGASATLRVQVKNASATTFSSPKTKNNGYITTVKKGAVDSVTEYYQNMYKLSTVGWVDAGAVTPLTKTISLDNSVSGISYENTTAGEMLTLHGTSHPTYRVNQSTQRLVVTFARTSGVPDITTESSKLFSGITVSESDGNTTITFDYASEGILWGYLVSYNGGDTRILLRSKPQVNGSGELSGIVVAIDAGHGGKDVGAQGLGANGGSYVEKQLNINTAEALKQELESKGAKVIMTREGDSTVNLSDRVTIAQNNYVDFFVSVHANSSSNKSASGTEVYYYEPNSKGFASAASARVSKNNSRTNRGGKYSCYVVTLVSYAPSILVEVGFLTNSSDYKSMNTTAGINATVKGISDSIVAQLQ